ncbi:ABC transporter permease subunit [Actinomadura sp. WAC 06369]|uniref:ABC transporter permease subunit n=1 Tax=Actinomadura sp. WAC 06369 TaxID=2203193 RepID=UPI000F79A3F0|nr:ABC transporter permease subunit [Actinomadura sp. WAC 06369]RSN71577.1 ABC transporter permease [Actinomadura sp. WAC 06369]
MIWLTLRQFRAPAAAGLAALAALAAVLALTGPGLADEYATGLASCGTSGDCERFNELFRDDYQFFFEALILLVLAVPALLGAFWGAPLVARELETGTHRLVWNQSITRTRWLAVKLAVVGAAAVAVTEGAVLAAAWWSDPVQQAASAEFHRLDPMPFAARGIVPMAYAAFAFTLGVTVGVLARRTLPAMAVTLAVFAAVQVAMPMLVRPHLLPAEESTVAITRDNLQQFIVTGGNVQVKVRPDDPGGWMLANHPVDASGREVAGLPQSLAAGACAPRPAEDLVERMGPGDECFAEIARLGYKQHVRQHSGDRFWAFQWLETGVFAALTAGLAGFCFFWVRRRLS